MSLYPYTTGNYKNIKITQKMQISQFTLIAKIAVCSIGMRYCMSHSIFLFNCTPLFHKFLNGKEQTKSVVIIIAHFSDFFPEINTIIKKRLLLMMTIFSSKKKLSNETVNLTSIYGGQASTFFLFNTIH